MERDDEMNKKKTQEQFIEDVLKVHGNEYIVLGEYKNAKEKILMKHTICGNEFHISPDSLLNKKAGCSICGHRKGADKLFLTHEQFINKVEEKYGNDFNNYKILSSYKGYKEYVSIMHLMCGNTYEQQAGDMMQGKRCKFCYGTLKKTQEQFEQEVYEIFGDEYTVIGEYINSKSNIKMRHNKCGKEYYAPVDSVLVGSRCSCENVSHGEYIIKNFLDFNNIQYEPQYRFNDCRNKQSLPFDFAIFENKYLKCLIEFDGAFHYSNTYEDLESVKFRDNIKTQYCVKNNIPLLRIPFWEIKNINGILLNFLSPLINIDISMPNKLTIKWEKNIAMKLYEIICGLPNGIYPKSLLFDLLEREKFISLHDILKQDIFKPMFKEKEITFSKYSLVIMGNYDDYEKYLQLIDNDKYDSNAVISRIKKIHRLKDTPKGKYFKSELPDLISLRGINKKSDDYNFFKKFLSNHNIVIQHNYVIFN